jgi:acyl-CoA synthetase (AMP-forming)/AMP-acid ligase II
VRQGDSGASYATATFAELDADATRIARGLLAWGVPPATRLALLVRPGIEFVTLVFGLLRAGMVIVLVDPGLGRRNLIRCLSDAKPEGFVAISLAQAARLWWRKEFPLAKWNVTVGRRWFWGGLTLEEIRDLGVSADSRDPNGSPEVGENRPATRWGRGCFELPVTRGDDPAAIIFTSGSTGVPKGVLYTHRMFDTQVSEIQAMYDIEPGGVDLSCFPLFALFNSAMGVTTILPDMDFSRPASADPQKLLAAANDWRVTQAFASPAVWRSVSAHCAKTGERIPSLRQVFSCGAPVPADVLKATLACVGDGAKMHTPYGATECLPVATIEAAEVLGETAARTDEGAGVCVGRKFDSIEWRVIRITDEPIAAIDDAEELPVGEVGELVVRGPQASPRYVTRTEFNAQAKIRNKRAGASSPPRVTFPHGGEDAPARCEVVSDFHPWHRMGDVGYLDDDGRFWYCGRKSQRVETAVGTMYTECMEAIFNKHPAVRRSALVGVGPRGAQKPVMILECSSPVTDEDVQAMKQATEGGSPAVSDGAIFDVDWPLPVDVRHNAKINREQLAAWATEQLTGRTTQSLAPRP